MARCYSACVRNRYPSVRPNGPCPLPRVWLISDARNDAELDTAIARLPPRSGMIFRHYHLPPPERRARFDQVARLSRRYGHLVILAGSARQARRWRADGCYGSHTRLSSGGPALRLVTAHSLTELGQANRMRANAVLLSPVFRTRSHLGARSLGAVRFKLLAAFAQLPVIALGGMHAKRAKTYGIRRWAAIDGLI